MLRKKGIKGNATDGPIIEHPQFGRIQWNQSCSHMPIVALEPDTEMMDMDEPTEQERPTELEMAAEHDEAAEQEKETEEQPDEEEEHEETITLRAADLYALKDTLEDIQFQISDIQRDARQDRLKTQDMLRAILDRLPPTP
jgi:hypothetical protein